MVAVIEDMKLDVREEDRVRRRQVMTPEGNSPKESGILVCHYYICIHIYIYLLVLFCSYINTL